MAGEAHKGVRVLPLTEKQETSDSEVVGNQRVNDLRREFFADVLLKEGGVASRAITPAVGDFNCQGNAVGYFFDDDIRQLRNILKHP